MRFATMKRCVVNGNMIKKQDRVPMSMSMMVKRFWQNLCESALFIVVGVGVLALVAVTLVVLTAIGIWLLAALAIGALAVIVVAIVRAICGK